MSRKITAVKQCRYYVVIRYNLKKVYVAILL